MQNIPAIESLADTSAARLVLYQSSRLVHVPALGIGLQPLNSGLMLKGHIHGLTLSNNTTDATNDIDIAPGQAASDDADPILMVLESTLTKRLDAAWAVGSGNGGLDTGSIADGTYHVWLIRRSDTGVVDALFSTSATSPTMPADYDQKRRIGSIIRASAAIRKFLQDGDDFFLETPVQDVFATNPGTSAATRTLTTPAGVKAIARVLSGGSNASGSWYGLLSSLDQADIAPTSAGPYNIKSFSTSTVSPETLVLVRTNTSSQIRSRLDASGASTSLIINTLGWIDKRGRDG